MFWGTFWFVMGVLSHKYKDVLKEKLNALLRPVNEN